MCAAQDDLAGGVNFPADLIGSQPVLQVQRPERVRGQATPILPLPGATCADLDTVTAEAITHSLLRHVEQFPDLARGQTPAEVEVSQEGGQVRGIWATALRPGPAHPTCPERHTNPAEQAVDALPVHPGELREAVGGQPLTEIQVRQPADRPVSLYGARKVEDMTASATVGHKRGHAWQGASAIT